MSRRPEREGARLETFFERNREALAAFSAMSGAIGRRADYVQGGGGNTSVKLDDGEMAIKASGYHLLDVRPDAGYAVLDSAGLRAFYCSHGPEDFEDVEAAGALEAKRAARAVEGLAPLRPSVEAGFHSLLSRFVAHSHSVYGNLAACCGEAEAVTREALSGAPYAYALIPYVNPGALLTFSLRDATRRALKETGREPAVILMRSHGLIAHADSMEDCLALHEDANARFQRYFGVKPSDYPQPKVRETPGGYRSDTPWLWERLQGGRYPDSLLLGEPLYPDQMVYFRGTLGETALIGRDSGKVSYRTPLKNAQAVEETLCAVIFLLETLARRGLTPVWMESEAQAFISGWESEKHRKALAEGKP